MKHQIGDRTEFSWGWYELKEILENQNVKMWRKLKEMVCPHCKKIIEQKTECIFHTIEIWTKMHSAGNIIDDISILGITEDGQYLLLPRDKFIEIKEKSEYLKNRQVNL